MKIKIEANNKDERQIYLPKKLKLRLENIAKGKSNYSLGRHNDHSDLGHMDFYVDRG